MGPAVNAEGLDTAVQDVADGGQNARMGKADVEPGDFVLYVATFDRATLLPRALGGVHRIHCTAYRGDLCGREDIGQEHIAFAIQVRLLSLRESVVVHPQLV